MSRLGIWFKLQHRFGFLGFKKIGFEEARANQFISKLETDNFDFSFLLCFFS
jgi:hypothetical protein